MLMSVTRNTGIMQSYAVYELMIFSFTSIIQLYAFVGSWVDASIWQLITM